MHRIGINNTLKEMKMNEKFDFKIVTKEYLKICNQKTSKESDIVFYTILESGVLNPHDYFKSRHKLTAK